MSEKMATILIFMTYGSLVFWLGYLVGRWRCRTKQYSSMREIRKMTAEIAKMTDVIRKRKSGKGM